jgi:probable F420-dependent oxidoreductase
MSEADFPRIGLEVNEWLDLRGRIDLAKWAESRGFDDVCVPEVTDPDAFVTCALALSETTRIRLGTDIIQMGPRSVPMLASGAATVGSWAPGRFALGVGVSTEAIVTGWHGLPWEEPLARARETVLALKKILSGEKTSEEGRQVRSRGFRLAFPPAVPPPVNLAALNKGMLKLAGEVADGVWLNYVPVNRIKQVTDVIRAGATAAGREMPEVLLSILCDVTDDPAASREQIRSQLTFYMSAPAYRSAFSWHGFEQEMADAAEAFARRDRAGVAKAVTDEIVDSITLIGTASQVRDRLMQYVEGGVTSPAVCAVDESRSVESLSAFAPKH